jgi:hypothetical protein
LVQGKFSKKHKEYWQANHGKGVKTRLRRLLVRMAQEQQRPLLEVQAEVLAKANREHKTVQEVLEGKKTARGSCKFNGPLFAFKEDSTATAGTSCQAARAKQERPQQCKKEEASEQDSTASGEEGHRPRAPRRGSPCSHSPCGSPDRREDGKEEPYYGRCSQRSQRWFDKPKGDIQVSEENIGYFMDSHNLVGIHPLKFNSMVLYDQQVNPRLSRLHSVGPCVLGPQRVPPADSVLWGRDSDDDWVVYSSVGWILPPTYRAGEYCLSSFGEVPYTLVSGQDLLYTGKKLLGVLRHTEHPAMGAARWMAFDDVVAEIKLEAYRVLAAALFNWDRQLRLFRFELTLQGGTAAHSTLWELGSSSSNAPRHRTITMHMRARRGHTVEMLT